MWNHPLYKKYVSFKQLYLINSLSELSFKYFISNKDTFGVHTCSGFMFLQFKYTWILCVKKLLVCLSSRGFVNYHDRFRMFFQRFGSVSGKGNAYGRTLATVCKMYVVLEDGSLNGPKSSGKHRKHEYIGKRTK